MKGILIDVENRVVKEVEVDKKNILDSMYKHIGCQLVDRVGLNRSDDLWVDDEGLLTVNEDSKFFSYTGCPSPLVGNGLILGHNGMGESVSPKITIEEVKMKVKFYNMREIQMMMRFSE